MNFKVSIVLQEKKMIKSFFFMNRSKLFLTQEVKFFKFARVEETLSKTCIKQYQHVNSRSYSLK